MKPEILLVEPMMPGIEAALDADYTVHRLSSAPDRERFLAEVGPRIRAVVTGGGTGVSNAVMDACPNLGVVTINGVGTDAVDLKHAQAKGVRVRSGVKAGGWNLNHSATKGVRVRSGVKAGGMRVNHNQALARA